jgi:hypothetical protein
MSESDGRSATEITELMGHVLQSEASEAFGQFVLRQAALKDMAPNADHALLDGVDASPDGGAAMAEAHLAGLPVEVRQEMYERAAMETGARLHAAATTLLAARDAAHVPVEVTPEMVAVAAVTELGDSR